MVLPSGETRVSSLSKGNPLAVSLQHSLSDCDRLTQTSHVGQTSMQDQVVVTNNPSAFKQTDVGLTDPRLVRNVSSQHEADFHFNDTLNNFSATFNGGCSKVEVECAEDDFPAPDRDFPSGSLVGRFARACLLHDVTTPPNSTSSGSFHDAAETPRKTSQQNLRCSSNFPVGLESWLSTQSGTGTPNDDSRSGSITDYSDVLPELSDMSASVEEQTNTSFSEIDSISRSPVVSKNNAVGDFYSRDQLRRENSDEPSRDVLFIRQTPESGVGDFDVYNIETTLPYMNWDYLEEQLQRAIEKEEISQSQKNDREKIRQKLAMGLDDDHFTTGSGPGAADRLFKKPSLQVRLHSAMNLQMCFVNEASTEVDAGHEKLTESKRPEKTSVQNDCQKEKLSNQLFHSLSSSNSLASSKNSLHSTMALLVPVNGASTTPEELDFFSRQARLQAEARLALAQVRPMAHMQLQLEKQTRKKSPIADIVGIPGFGDGKNSRLNRQLLRRMNLGQLQVVVNDLHAQIEAFNMELMEFLMERDDLHMAQDSMLVDIEDLTRRAQEYDMRLKSKLAGTKKL